MDIRLKYKDIVSNIFSDISQLILKLRERSEDQLRHELVKRLEIFLESIGDERPIFLEEHWVDVLIGDIVVDTKKMGELSGRKKLDKYKGKTKEYIQKHKSPFGILTDLKKIYFFELKTSGEIVEISDIPTDFDYYTFCYLLEILFGEKRKKFISEIALVTDFGYVNKNKLIRSLLGQLFLLFRSSKNKKTKMIFHEWKKLFNLAETTNKEYLEKRRNSLEEYFRTEINQKHEYICLFVMHTLLSLIVKLLTYSFLGHLNEWRMTKEENILSLKKFYEKLEKGNFFEAMGVINMCHNDFFSWYLCEEWDNDFFTLLLALKSRTSLYRHANFDPMTVKDALQKLYENFIPKEIRHSFGEYYTPPAVAEYMVAKSKPFLEEKLSYRAIDPTCGSGTFLIALLKDKILNRRNPRYEIRKITSEVVGVDLNPIAVLMSKFNYLLTVYPYFKESGDKTNIEIPVYLGDSSYMPIEETIGNVKCLTYEYYFPKNVRIKFPRIVFPLEFIRHDNFLPALAKVEDMITKGKAYKEICDFLFKVIGEKLLNEEIKEKIAVFIKNLIEYQRKNLNTIWLFIFMNYLKPFALPKFDLIIGNPPWVRWAVLPYDYKEKIKRSLREEGIFSRDTNYGGVDLNVCALIAYKVIENLSNTKGLLTFIFPQGVLVNKSYEGFRNFTIGDKKAFPVLILKPIRSFFNEEPVILFLRVDSI